MTLAAISSCLIALTLAMMMVMVMYSRDWTAAKIMSDHPIKSSLGLSRYGQPFYFDFLLQ